MTIPKLAPPPGRTRALIGCLPGVVRARDFAPRWARNLAPRWVVVCVLVLCPCLGGCGGKKAPGGRGTLSGATGTRAAGATAIRQLHVKGSPYEMGWWHGHLLRAEIRSLLSEWRDALFLATVGVPYAERTNAAARALHETVEFYVDQCQFRMPERLRQEYDGLSAGSGLPVLELIEMEVLRDVLRVKGLEARLTASMAASADGGALSVRVWWAGPDAERFGRHLLVIRREPAGGPAHTALAWPGGLGAIAVLHHNGLLVATGDVEITDEHRKGFPGGLPFALLIRLQIQEHGQFDATAGGLQGTMGHSVMTAFGATRQAVSSVETAVAGVELPRLLSETRFLALGPYQHHPGPRADALLADANKPGLTQEERFALVLRHADADPTTETFGPSMVVRWSPKGVSMTIRATPKGTARRVSYRAQQPK